MSGGIDNFEIVTAKCSECGKVKRLSFEKEKRLRHTYCMDCQMAVIWEKVESAAKTDGQKLVEFCDRMMAGEPTPPEFSKTIDEHFWELG